MFWSKKFQRLITYTLLCITPPRGRPLVYNGWITEDEPELPSVLQESGIAIPEAKETSHTITESLPLFAVLLAIKAKYYPLDLRFIFLYQIS